MPRYWVMKFRVDKEVATTGFGADEVEAEVDARKALAPIYSVKPTDFTLLSHSESGGSVIKAKQG